ncbi:MAG TPA: hypothetical protein VF392_15260 [Terracidiphilus sp.]
MTNFGPAAIIGLCLGFLWGTGCSLAILYSIYLGGYRKAVEESQMPQKPARFLKALARLQQKNAQKAAEAAARK